MICLIYITQKRIRSRHGGKHGRKIKGEVEDRGVVVVMDFSIGSFGVRDRKKGEVDWWNIVGIDTAFIAVISLGIGVFLAILVLVRIGITPLKAHIVVVVTTVGDAACCCYVASFTWTNSRDSEEKREQDYERIPQSRH